MYSWISAEFLAGPPGYCLPERECGPNFATEEQAITHAKANVARETASVSDVRTPTSDYAITKHDLDKERLFKDVYVRVVGMRYHQHVTNFENVKLVEENDNPYDDQAIAAYAGDTQFGYLTREDARFYRSIMNEPIKEMYVIRHRTNHIDIAIKI